MTPENIIARVKENYESAGIEAAWPTFDDDLYTAISLLTEAGYEIRKPDPSMVYVPREPTKEIIKRMAGGLSDKCGPFSVGEAEECCISS